MSGGASNEDFERFTNCINVPNRQTQKLLDEIEDLKKENMRLKEEVRNKDKAIREMQEKRDDEIPEEISFALHAWMQEDVKDLNLSFKQLMKHTVEVYKNIMEKGSSKEKSKSAAERKRLANEVEKLEELCEKIASETKKRHEWSIRTIVGHLGIPIDTAGIIEEESTDDTTIVDEWISDQQRTLLELKEIGKMCEQISRDVTAGREEKEEKKRQLQENEEKLKTNQKLIKPFLCYKHGNNEEILTITYNEKTGYYQDEFTRNGYAFQNRKSSWKLDGVERHGVQATLEENCLVVIDINYSPFECQYELRDNGIYRNNFFFK